MTFYAVISHVMLWPQPAKNFLFRFLSCSDQVILTIIQFEIERYLPRKNHVQTQHLNQTKRGVMCFLSSSFIKWYICWDLIEDRASIKPNPPPPPLDCLREVSKCGSQRHRKHIVTYQISSGIFFFNHYHDIFNFFFPFLGPTYDGTRLLETTSHQHDDMFPSSETTPLIVPMDKRLSLLRLGRGGGIVIDLSDAAPMICSSLLLPLLFIVTNIPLSCQNAIYLQWLKVLCTFDLW